ncbi:hypothetical protein [Pseudaestuariivita atlantica]|uniref:Lipoprotein n=1 Tax=Pseudaestuariivita atlantica TaxID=1317121 RepID=A0A0L1JSI8_9RHOB|nr:hypothetical protein [Pseudaestuariivita atlantica]KNG94701.1 hypothetical protein ATO11_04735 [Pseudaestuariivita atlantica]
MKHLACAAALCVAPLPALADCTAEIAALFDGGALDAYARPPHRHFKEIRGEDGTLKQTFTSVVETPLKTISDDSAGTYALAVEDRAWTGPGEDGPWTPSPANFPADRKGTHKAMMAAQVRNLKDTVCHGTVTRDGRDYLGYTFTTQTDPDPQFGNAFFGSTDTVFIDPATGRLAIWQQTGLFSSWLPTPQTDVYTTTFTYDPTISIEAPE